MELRQPDDGFGDLGRGDKRPRGSIVLALLGRSGGEEAGLGRGSLRESLDLELRRGGKRRFWSLTMTGDGGGEPVSTISTVTMGVVEMTGRECGGDQRLKAKRRPVSFFASGR